MVPLTAENVSKLRLLRNSRFASSALMLHVKENEQFCAQVAGSNEYAIGGRWRRRADIGYVVEMTQGPNREKLLNHLKDLFSRAGMQAVVVACDDVSLFVSFYAKHGFEKLDEIIELERSSTGRLPAVSNIVVRPCTPQDLEAVIDVDSHSFPWLWQNTRSELDWYYSLPDVEVYVAESPTEQVVGYTGITIRGPHGHLDRLAVHSSRQREGYGAALLNFAVRRLEQRRARHITLSTQANNLRSQNLYRKFGFHHTFRSQAIYGIRLD